MSATTYAAIEELNKQEERKLSLFVNSEFQKISIHFVPEKDFKKIIGIHPTGYSKREGVEWVEIGNITFFKGNSQ